MTGEDGAEGLVEGVGDLLERERGVVPQLDDGAIGVGEEGERAAEAVGLVVVGARTVVGRQAQIGEGGGVGGGGSEPATAAQCSNSARSAGSGAAGRLRESVTCPGMHWCLHARKSAVTETRCGSEPCVSNGAASSTSPS